MIRKYDADQNRDLIFFYSHENCPARATAMPVIAWMAEKNNIEYDGYFCVRPSVADIGDAMPYTGNKHDEQFYYTANFFNHIYFLALSEETPIQFERFLQARKNTTIVKNTSTKLVDFYKELFSLFKEPIPDSAVVFPSNELPFPNEKVEIGDFLIEGKSKLDTFCYPEIFFRNSLALNYELDDVEIQKLVSLGLKKIYLIFCQDEAKARYEKLGLEVEIIDKVLPEDNYASITGRIVERWINKAKGMALGNDPITLKWTPKYLRERILPIAAVQSLPKAIEMLGKFTDQIGNKLVWGSQVFNDNIIADASKHNIIFSLAHDVEVGITIKDKTKLPDSWLKDAPAPWEVECDDDYLIKQLDKGNIPVCFLHYASDIGHLPSLPRLLDLHSIDNFTAGLAFPTSWWDYAEEQLEQLSLSKEMGGVFPTIEPLMCSAGIGVATEAKGYLSPTAYLENLKKAKTIIENYAGKRNVPVGHYSFQDACPQYKHQTGEPQFDVLVDAGFQYAITYKNEGQFSQIVYSKDDFIVLNQQTEHWSFDPLTDLQNWEQKMLQANKNGWIIIGLDAPFWGFVPCYFGIASKGLSLTGLQECMSFALKGGESGKLFLAKPHEVVRFAKLMCERNLL